MLVVSIIWSCITWVRMIFLLQFLECAKVLYSYIAVYNSPLLAARSFWVSKPPFFCVGGVVLHPSSCPYKHPNCQIMAKQLNISPHVLLCAYSSYSFADKDFQRQFELVMSTTNHLMNTTNPLPTTRISNNLKNQDLMAGLQKHLD